MNKHFLLGAGLALVITFSASSVFAQFLQPNSLIRCLALGGKMATTVECAAADASSGNPTGEKSMLENDVATGSRKPGEMVGCMSLGMQSVTVAECIKAAGGTVPGVSSPSLQPSLSQTTTPTPTQSDSGISELKKMLEEMKAEDKTKKEQVEDRTKKEQVEKEGVEKEEQDNFLEEMRKMLEQSQQPEKEISVDKKVNKSKLSSAKNPAVTLAKKGLKNVDKLLNTLSKKFNKERTKTKKLAVVRSVAKDFMKLCTKYGPKEEDEEFSDEESFTCDEFVADLSEPIAAALKSKDADLAFELTFDALDVNFKELFNSLTQ